jgi:hypothetical protein
MPVEQTEADPGGSVPTSAVESGHLWSNINYRGGAESICGVGLMRREAVT